MRKMKCWVCGCDATETRTVDYDGLSMNPREPSPYSRCYCKKCREEVDRKEKSDKALYIKLKKHEMFLKACNLLEKQHTNMYEYKEAIEAVEEFVEEQPDKFDSSYEVLAAIVLVHNRIRIKTDYLDQNAKKLPAAINKIIDYRETGHVNWRTL